MVLRGGGVISIIGGGGKTTLMERLAREILVRGETVLVTTTTRIMMPRGSHLRPDPRSSETGESIALRARAFDGGQRLPSCRG
jgi:probable selenium-dependent hydroxylase accessory protein YqeC